MSTKNDISHNFIKLVKAIREERSLTIEQLAELAGVHRTTIGLLERHERTPTLHVAAKIANAVETPLSALIYKAESKTSLISQYSNKLDTPIMNRQAPRTNLRNEDKLIETTGFDGETLLGAINKSYQTLDTIDSELVNTGSLPIANLVELANLSSMVGNMVGGGIADCSNGLYSRNKPHAYPDLLPQQPPAVNLELKMALETNKPKGHLPKAGTYITFRYVLGDKNGNFTRGKDMRGDTVWIWEVKVGNLTENDFSCSNTDGDSGKTAVIKTEVFNKMPLVYFDKELLPYGSKGDYPGFN